MKPIPASRLTPAAPGWLAESRTIRPLHIFQHVCNLINNDEVVLSLQAEPVPPSPLSISLPPAAVFERGEAGFVDWIEPGTEIRWQHDLLLIGERAVDVSPAELWDPSPAWPQLRRRADEWLPLLLDLVPLLLEEAPPNSLAPLLATEAQPTDPKAEPILAQKILATARLAAQQLQHSIKASDRAAMAVAAGSLAGLGGGLTPSGDDYLMGVMHALWATRPEPEATAHSAIIGGAAAARTGPLSATWLMAATRGEASGSWHQLTADLLAGHEENLRTTSRRIMGIGHSSGADGLAGFIDTLR